MQHPPRTPSASPLPAFAALQRAAGAALLPAAAAACVVLLATDRGIGDAGVVLALASSAALTAALGRSVVLGELQRRREAREQADLVHLYHATVRCLASAIDARECPDTDHVSTVEYVAAAIARRMGLSAAEVEGVRTAALLLDIGTLAVPETILLQRGRPSPEEFAVIHNHPLIGSQVLEGISFPWPVQQTIRAHHERWDGTGYPDRLRGEEIPLPARILAVADVYGAVTSSRAYRGCWSHDEAVEHIRSLAGVHFDARVVEAFLAVEADVREARLHGDIETFQRASSSIGRANQRFAALWEISQVASASLDLRVRLDNVCEKVADALGCDACAVFLASESGQELTCQAFWPDPGPEGVDAVAMLGQPGTGRAAGETRALIIRAGKDALKTSDGAEVTMPYEWAAIAPLRLEGMVLGTVNAYRTHRDFSIEDLDLLETLARHASVPVAAATLFEATRRNADRDPLTGLYNLRYFCAQMENELARARRKGHSFSIIAIDLDHFKAVNDTLGHQAGDALLRDVARLFTKAVREYDVVVRYGGDEFVIILPDADASQACETIRRLRSELKSYTAQLPGLVAVGFGASFGSATYDQDGCDPKTLLETADRRMYECKRLAGAERPAA